MREDILSDVLRTVRLSGAVFFDVAASSPWVAEAPPAATVAPKVMPRAQHVIEYHVITSGFGWATLLDSGDDPVRLAPGSVIMFPQGDRHVLSSKPQMRAKPDLSVFDQPEHLSPPFYLEQFGDGPEETRMICGFIGCDLVPFNPVIHTLPRMVHVPDGYTHGDGWLSSLIRAIMKESRKQRVGAQSVLSKLSELLFIEVVRSYTESLPDDARGWLAALTDPCVGRAIELLHDDPKRSWTLESLARDVGVSRTVLVNRFSEHLGVAPMTYLTNWRMQLAARMLTDGGTPISRIADEVGYKSEAAFSRTFKRCTSISPGAWRTRNASNGPTGYLGDHRNQGTP
jgi:AraC-like DNA-binding protein